MEDNKNDDGLMWVIVVWILFIVFIAYTGTFPDNIVAAGFLSLR